MVAFIRYPARGRAALLVGLLACGGLFAGPRLEARADDGQDVAAQLARVATLRQRGEYAKAVDAARSAVAAAEKTFGRDDPRAVPAKSVLASAYLDVGDRRSAAPLLQAALASLERAEPRSMGDIGVVVGDLAQTIDDPKEAEPLFRRAVAIAEQAHGPEHPRTALALNNLGGFLREQHRADEAEPPMRRALQIRERMEGMESPATAQSLCTLGTIAADRGDLSVAESLVRGSLERRRAILPKGHPDVAESCDSLARILLVFGKDRAEDALALASEALVIYRAANGPTNGMTLLAMHTKADALALLERHAESERLHRDFIERLESQPAAADQVAEGLRDFALHMLLAGKARRAVELSQRAIALRQRAHGPDDASLSAMRRVLAEALYADKTPDKAVAEGRAMLADLTKRGGAGPLDEAAARYALGKYLLAAGGMDEARSLLRQSVELSGKIPGDGTRQTLRSIWLLATTYVVTNDLAEAERLVDDGLNRFAAASDVRTGDIAVDLIGLRAKIYRATGRVKEAEQAEAAVAQTHAETLR